MDVAVGCVLRVEQLAPHLHVNLHRFATPHAAFLKALGADIQKMNATRLQQVESERLR